MRASVTRNRYIWRRIVGTALNRRMMSTGGGSRRMVMMSGRNVGLGVGLIGTSLLVFNNYYNGNMIRNDTETTPEERDEEVIVTSLIGEEPLEEAATNTTTEPVEQVEQVVLADDSNDGIVEFIEVEGNKEKKEVPLESKKKEPVGEVILTDDSNDDVPEFVAVEEEQEQDQSGAFNPETGEINWDCPCLGGMAHGPCGPEFKEAFSCFVFSQQEPKGVDCIEKFKGMQDCFRDHPEVYSEELRGDDSDEVKSEDTATTTPS